MVLFFDPKFKTFTGKSARSVNRWSHNFVCHPREIGSHGFDTRLLAERILPALRKSLAPTRGFLELQAALAQGTKWGKVSAGFAGGRAAGQLWRGEDDFQAAMCGAVAGGVMASESIKGIPGSVATFVMFSYFIEKLTANGKAGAAKGGAPQQLQPRAAQSAAQSAHRPAVDYGTRPAGAGPTPGQRLDKLLGFAA